MIIMKLANIFLHPFAATMESLQFWDCCNCKYNKYKRNWGSMKMQSLLRKCLRSGFCEFDENRCHQFLWYVKVGLFTLVVWKRESMEFASPTICPLSLQDWFFVKHLTIHITFIDFHYIIWFHTSHAYPPGSIHVVAKYTEVWLL